MYEEIISRLEMMVRNNKFTQDSIIDYVHGLCDAAEIYSPEDAQKLDEYVTSNYLLDGIIYPLEAGDEIEVDGLYLA